MAALLLILETSSALWAAYRCMAFLAIDLNILIRTLNMVWRVSMPKLVLHISSRARRYRLEPPASQRLACA